MTTPAQRGSEEGIAATVKSAGGRVLSNGWVELYPRYDLAKFYPLDKVTFSTLQAEGEILFLSEKNQSLKILSVTECLEIVGSPAHFHLRVALSD